MELWGHRYIIYKSINPEKQFNIFFSGKRTEIQIVFLARGTTNSRREQSGTLWLDNSLDTAGGTLSHTCHLNSIIVIIFWRFKMKRAQFLVSLKILAWNQTWTRGRRGARLMSVKASESQKNRMNGSKKFSFFFCDSFFLSPKDSDGLLLIL